MSTNRQYELVYVLNPESTDEQVAELHTQIEQIVGRFQGTLDKTENWGCLLYTSPSPRDS